MRAEADHAPVVELDALDRYDFDQLLGRSPSVSRLVEQGERLLPDFRALMRDVYAAHAKAVVRLVERKHLPGSAALRHLLVSELVADKRYVEFHRLTQLRPDNAGLATLRVGRELLRELKAGRLMLPRELRTQFAADAAEQEVEELNEEAQAARELAERTGDEAVKRALEAEADALDEAAQEAQQALASRQGELDDAARQVPQESLDRVRGVLEGLKDRMEEAEETGHAPLPLPMEAPGAGEDGGDAIAAMDLSDKLATNKLLTQLAKLIGAFRAEARAARRQRVPRAKTEVYGLTRGNDLARLLPHELLSMRHPVLRRDFRRRLLERQLMSYRTRGDEREGRGPAVICLDVSGSMAGSKAIWAKAVALTLADWARRQHRAVTVLTFSSGPGGMRHHELVDGPGARGLAGRPLFKRTALLTFAEERVGGGTDFAPPLTAAQGIIADEKRFDRGDIVLITDGAAQLNADYVERFAGFRKERDCRCLGVVIDVADHRLDTLAQVCDGVVKVSDLDARNARAVFAAFDR